MDYFCNVLRTNLCFNCERSRAIRGLVGLFIIRSRMSRYQTFLPCRFFCFHVVISLIFSSRGRCHFDDRALRNVPTEICVHYFKIVSGVGTACTYRLLRTIFCPLGIARHFPCVFFNSANGINKSANNWEIVGVILTNRNRLLLFRVRDSQFNGCCFVIFRVNSEPFFFSYQR